MNKLGNNIILTYGDSGLIKEAKAGFSFTSLFFGVFAPLFRGDFKGFFLQFVLAIFTGGLSWLVVPFIYNKRYIKRLIEKGYVAANQETHDILSLKGILIKK